MNNMTNSKAVEKGLELFETDQTVIISENTQKETDSVIVYHGSPKKFEAFKPDFMRTNGTAEGIGFYFTDNKSIAEGYAQEGYLYKVEFNGKKALSSEEITMTYEEVKKLILALDEKDEYLSNFGDKEWDGLEKVLNKTVNSTFEFCNNDVEIISTIYNTNGEDKDVLTLVYELLGYDHTVVNEAEWGNQKIYIALTNDIIKIMEVKDMTKNIEIIAGKKKRDTNGNPLYKIEVMVNGEKWFKPLDIVQRNNTKSGSYTITSFNLDGDLQQIKEEVEKLI